MKRLECYDTPEQCPDCNQEAHKVIMANVFGDDKKVAWVRDANVALSPRGEMLIQSRNQLNRILKERGLEHAD